MFPDLVEGALNARLRQPAFAFVGANGEGGAYALAVDDDGGLGGGAG